MFPSTSSRETSGLSGKQNQLSPSGSDIKCIIVRDSEPIRLLESPRSLSVYLTIIPQSRMGSEAMAYEAEDPMSN